MRKELAIVFVFIVLFSIIVVSQEDNTLFAVKDGKNIVREGALAIETGGEVSIRKGLYSDDLVISKQMYEESVGMRDVVSVGINKNIVDNIQSIIYGESRELSKPASEREYILVEFKTPIKLSLDGEPVSEIRIPLYGDNNVNLELFQNRVRMVVKSSNGKVNVRNILESMGGKNDGGDYVNQEYMAVYQGILEELVDDVGEFEMLLGGDSLIVGLGVGERLKQKLSEYELKGEFVFKAAEDGEGLEALYMGEDVSVSKRVAVEKVDEEGEAKVVLDGDAEKKLKEIHDSMADFRKGRLEAVKPEIDAGDFEKFNPIEKVKNLKEDDNVGFEEILRISTQLSPGNVKWILQNSNDPVEINWALYKLYELDDDVFKSKMASLALIRQANGDEAFKNFDVRLVSGDDVYVDKKSAKLIDTYLRKLATETYDGLSDEEKRMKGEVAEAAFLAFKDRDDIRILVAESLFVAGLGDRKIDEDLVLGLANDKDLEVRRVVASIASKLPSALMVDLMDQFSRDENENVRYEVANNFGFLLADNPEKAAEIAQVFADRGSLEHKKLIVRKVNGQYNVDSGVGVLYRFRNDKNNELMIDLMKSARWLAEDTDGKMTAETQEKYDGMVKLALANEEDYKVRDAAYEGLKFVGDQAFLEETIRGLDSSESRFLRTYATLALPRLENKELTLSYAKKFLSLDYFDRTAFFSRALPRFDEDVRVQIIPLIDYKSKEFDYYRRYLPRSLKGKAFSKVIFEDLMNDKEILVRRSAAGIIGEVSDEGEYFDKVFNKFKSESDGSQGDSMAIGLAQSLAYEYKDPKKWEVVFDFIRNHESGAAKEFMWDAAFSRKLSDEKRRKLVIAMFKDKDKALREEALGADEVGLVELMKLFGINKMNGEEIEKLRKEIIAGTWKPPANS